MADPHFAVPALPGLTVEAVEWLPSGAESGLVRVRGLWADDSVREADLPVLVLRVDGTEHRFDSLPDARFSRDPSSWRGTYLVAAELVARDPEALWLEWPSGSRSGLPELARGVEPPRVEATAPAAAPEEPGGQVIDRAVLAERRARRAEDAERAQTRKATEALKAVEVLELRSAELERRLEEAVAEREALSAAPDRTAALTAALASAAALRARSRDWQLRLRSAEVARSGEAVRLAVLEAQRAAEKRSMADLTAQLATAADAAAAARTELGDARAAWERRREELESALFNVQQELAAARAEVAERTAVETVARTAIEDELDRVRAAHAATRAELATATTEVARLTAELDAARASRADVERLTSEVESTRADSQRLTAEVAAARADADTARADLDAARADVEHLTTELETTRSDSQRLATDLDAARADSQRFAAELEAARADSKRLAAERDDALARIETLTRVEPAEHSGPEDLERLAREQTEAAAAREPARDAARIAADLDAAADSLRRRAEAEPVEWEPPGGGLAGEPPAPDAEPAIEVPETDRPAGDVEPAMESPRMAVDYPALTPPPPEPPAPDAEPRVDGPEVDRAAQAKPAVEAQRSPVVMPAPPEAPEAASEGDEPPAPDAEPAVEWSEHQALPPPAPVSELPAVAEAAAPESEPGAVADPVPSVATEKPAGPLIVPATRPPSRADALGASRRDYPLLRGAIVKLAHDDPEAAGRLLAALLPAQAALLAQAITYDLNIREVGTFGVTIAAGRPYVEKLDRPRPRSKADFCLTVDALRLAELLAGVDHRVRRFFGPVRVRGRRSRFAVLRELPHSQLSLTEAARAGVKLDPGLAYRTLAYAVHPTWTRGHSFTVAQAIADDPPQTWFLIARDGAGLAVGSAAGTEPDATVSMSRTTFDRLLRGEDVPRGERPVVRGDRDAVAVLREWTLRAQGAA